MFKRLLISLSLLLVSAVASASTATFVKPQDNQTGSYTVSTVDVDGTTTGISHTGVFLEVITGDHDATIYGYHIPNGSVFNWGFFANPEYTLLFQSPVPPPAPSDDGKTYAIDVGRTVVDETGDHNIVLGHGFIVYDPLNTGSGGTADVVITFDNPTEFHGQTVSALRLRIQRLTQNVAILGCQRSGDDFSPPPPPNLCNP